MPFRLEPTGIFPHCREGLFRALALSVSDALASTTGQAPVVTGARRARRSSAETLAKGLGLRIASSDELIIRRRRRGKGWSYIDADGRGIKDPATIKRLAALAVPPAYAEVLYADDPCAHLQAIGRDAAGRLQYRYHAEWEKVREMRKARRLSRLAEALPRIHRSIGQHLAGNAPQRELALAAVIELVGRSAIRPGSESYARLRGTRGAATLLKSNVATYGETVKLTFRSKGGKHILKEFDAPRLCTAIAIMRRLPGRRLFQYKTESGEVRAVTTTEVNAFLREIAGAKISLKDFRTLLASASALEALAQEEPAGDERQRRRQVLNAVRTVAEDLANTPAICRKSYVHATVVAAFEEGVLERFSDTLKSCRSPSRRAQVLAEIMARAGA
jgi:DNA topoisomerase-1